MDQKEWLWTEEGGGRNTTKLGHELCGLIHDDVRRRVISVTLPCWCACTSSVDRVRIRNRRELKGSVEGARVSGRTPFESAPPRDSTAPPRSHTTQHHPPTRTPYIRPQGSTTTAAVQPQVPQQPRRLAFVCGTRRPPDGLPVTPALRLTGSRPRPTMPFKSFTSGQFTSGARVGCDTAHRNPVATSWSQLKPHFRCNTPT